MYTLIKTNISLALYFYDVSQCVLPLYMQWGNRHAAYRDGWIIILVLRKTVARVGVAFASNILNMERIL